MKDYIVQKNQSLVDIAIQLYGNVDALPELLALNPDALGTSAEFDPGLAVSPDTVLYYDDTSTLCNRLAVLTRGPEVLATVTENEVLLELPIPPPPPPYVFHPRTLDFFDGIADVPGGLWEAYFSMEEAIILDRLVRDLNGESNPDYPTSDIWSSFIFMCPIMGSDPEVHAKNLFVPHTNMILNGAMTHGLNKIGMDGNTAYADTRCADGIDTDQQHFEMGFVFSNFINLPNAVYPNFFMGSSGMWVRTWSSKYDAMVTLTSGTFGSATYYQANDYLHLCSNSGLGKQSLYLGGNGLLIAQKTYVAGTSAGTDIMLGGAIGHRAQCEFNMAYILNAALTDDERKGLMNAVNYFLYKKGVRATFNVIY